MFNYLLKKIIYSVLVIYGVLTIVFFLFHVLPGDPARMMLDKREDSKQLTLIKHKYGFDKPLYLQYLYYLNDEYMQALSLIDVFEKEYGLTTRLKQLKNKLVLRNKPQTVISTIDSLPKLISDFELSSWQAIFWVD